MTELKVLTDFKVILNPVVPKDMILIVAPLRPEEKNKCQTKNELIKKMLDNHRVVIIKSCIQEPEIVTNLVRKVVGFCLKIFEDIYWHSKR